MRSLSGNPPIPVGATLGSVALVLLALLGCDRNKSRAPEEGSNKEPALLDPEEPARDLPSRCKARPGSQPVTIRARAGGGGGPAAVDVGTAAPLPSGFVLGALRTEKETKAFASWIDGAGGEQVVDLGQVHGAVEAPSVVPVGKDALIVVPDNDAGHTRLRLAKLGFVGGKSQVTWGAEVRARRGETSYFSLASGPSGADGSKGNALLAWDDFDQGSLKSQVRGLLFSTSTMKAPAPEKALTGADEDAVWPQVLPRKGGYYLTWLSYGALDPSKIGPSESGGLVEEPPRSIKVALLDSSGKSLGEPLSLTPANAYVLAYDIALAGDQLLVASRSTDQGRVLEGEPIVVQQVGPDGSVTTRPVEHPRLGPGAPLFLAGPSDEKPWLFARGPDQEVLFGKVGVSGEISGFEEEPSLEGMIPVARSGDDVLSLQPDGLDLRLSVYRCSD